MWKYIVYTIWIHGFHFYFGPSPFENQNTWSFLLNSSCFFANNHKGDWFLLNPFLHGSLELQIDNFLGLHMLNNILPQGSWSSKMTLNCSISPSLARGNQHLHEYLHLLSDVSYYWLPIFHLRSVKFALRDLDLVFTNLLFCNKFFQTWSFVLGEIFGQICFSSSFATRFSVSLGGKIQFSSSQNCSCFCG